jgi:hypothetical protein
MSEQTKREVFKHLVKEYAKLEAEWHSAHKRHDQAAAHIARIEKKKLITAAEALGLNIKEIEMQGWGYSLDILAM